MIMLQYISTEQRPCKNNNQKQTGKYTKTCIRTKIGTKTMVKFNKIIEKCKLSSKYTFCGQHCGFEWPFAYLN